MADVIHKKWCAYASNKTDLCTCGSAPALHWLGYCAKHECKYDENEGCELCREEHEMTGTTLDESAYCDKCGEHKDQAHACWNTEPPRAEKLHREDCDCVIELGLACDCDELDKLTGQGERRSTRLLPFVQKETPAGLFPRHPDCKNHLSSEEPGCDWCQNQFELDGMRDPLPVRAQCLQECIALTTGDRNKTYGPPEPNLTLQMELWTLYKRAAGDKHSMAHDAAMQHVFAKIARIASGPPLHEDNYVDLSGYAALAYECDVEVLGVES